MQIKKHPKQSIPLFFFPKKEKEKKKEEVPSNLLRSMGGTGHHILCCFTIRNVSHHLLDPLN